MLETSAYIFAMKQPRGYTGFEGQWNENVR